MRQVKLVSRKTKVSAEKSINEIESILGHFGASRVMKEYAGDGTIESIAFELNGRGYKLPNNKEGVQRILFKGNKSNRVNGNKKKEERAYRVSWRIIKEWTHAQLSLIASGQAETEQVLLPFMWNGKENLYEVLKKKNFQLPDASTDESFIEGEVLQND